MEQNMREPQTLTQFGALLTGVLRTPVSRIVRSGAVLAGTGALALGLLAAAPASARSLGPASAMVADNRTEEVARWSDSVWNAAKSGDLTAVEGALKAVPESLATENAKVLRELVALRTQHADEGAKTRESDRAKALDELKGNLAKGEVTKALTDAVRLQTLSDDWAAVLAIPEMVELVKVAETRQADADAAGDFLVAQEILFRLRTLFEEGDAQAFRRYGAMLDTVNKRIMLLAQYAPRELWRLRKAYAERVEPEREFPAFNEAFANDWKEALDGVSKGMLTSALTTAANDHISSGGWEPLISGGLRAVRVLATTEALKESVAVHGHR
jgi:hypothetical protein